jgi:hypothetical protein
MSKCRTKYLKDIQITIHTNLESNNNSFLACLQNTSSLSNKTDELLFTVKVNLNNYILGTNFSRKNVTRENYFYRIVQNLI